MYRLKPTWRFAPYPFEVFPAKTNQAKCIIHNIWNNLSREVAQFPEELITYVKSFYHSGWKWGMLSKLGSVLAGHVLPL